MITSTICAFVLIRAIHDFDSGSTSLSTIANKISEWFSRYQTSARATIYSVRGWHRWLNLHHVQSGSDCQRSTFSTIDHLSIKIITCSVSLSFSIVKTTFINSRWIILTAILDYSRICRSSNKSFPSNEISWSTACKVVASNWSHSMMSRNRSRLLSNRQGRKIL